MLTRPNTSSSTKLNEPIKLKDNWYIDLEGDEDQLWESLPYYNELRQDVFKVYNYLPNDLSDTACIFLKTNFQFFISTLFQQNFPLIIRVLRAIIRAEKR